MELRWNFLDLFSGIGGIAAGLHCAGMNPVQFVELDPSARAWLAHHWPEVPQHDDIQSFTGAGLRGHVDVVAGGFPCQPVSVAGKGHAQEDERWLWPEMLRIIQLHRPRWVLAENVPGLRARGADIVLSDLGAAGYAAWPHVVGAADAGLPHVRRRVWILARRIDPGLEGLLGQEGLGDAHGHGQERRTIPDAQGQEVPPSARAGQDVGDASRLGPPLGLSLGRDPGPQFAPTLRTGVVARPGERQGDWEPQRLAEPGVGSSAYGLPARVASPYRKAALHALGNAVVPLIVEALGWAMMNTESAIHEYSKAH